MLLKSLCLSFHICKIEIIIGHTSGGYGNVLCPRVYQAYSKAYTKHISIYQAYKFYAIESIAIFVKEGREHFL